MKLIGIAALIIALSVGYYFVIYLPQRDADQKAAQIQTQEQTQIQQELEKNKQTKDLQNCLDAAQNDYTVGWNNECKAQGLQANCSLPEYNVNVYEKRLQNEKDDCYKQYSLK